MVWPATRLLVVLAALGAVVSLGAESSPSVEGSSAGGGKQEAHGEAGKQPVLATDETGRRPVKELLDTDDTWAELVQGWISEATNSVTVIPVDRATGELALYRSQVTQRAPMGALALNTGGLVVADGWLRILGASTPAMEGQDAWNGLEGGLKSVSEAGYYVVGWDVIGGVFVQNGGAFGPDRGDIWYLMPEELNWQDLNVGYTDWLRWAFLGDVKLFYDGFQWTGWREEVAGLVANHLFEFYPPLFMSAGGAPRGRRPADARDYFARRLKERAVGLRRQTGDVAAGGGGQVWSWAQGAPGPWQLPKAQPGE